MIGCSTYKEQITEHVAWLYHRQSSRNLGRPDSVTGEDEEDPNHAIDDDDDEIRCVYVVWVHRAQEKRREIFQLTE
jgi:hypothetical protein